jgi:hypothetical protein
VIIICGIAGYSCSLDHVEQFGKKRTNKIVYDAISTNVHRGADAGGWMASNGKEIKFFKGKGHPNFILKQKLFPPFDPTTLAVHTRAATEGDPRDNLNNHPVGWKGLWTVHNGYISNHQTVKHMFTETGDFFSIPDVDSAALSIVINDCMPDPAQGISDDFIDVLDSEVLGSFAFASMWSDHPDFILVGRESPSSLYLATNDGIAVWGSEQDTVARLGRRFGHMANSWTHGWVADGVFYLFYQGKLVDIKKYPKRTYTSGVKAATHKRVSTKRTLEIDTNAGWSHWFNDEGAPLSMFQTGAKTLQLKDDTIENYLPDGIKKLIGDIDKVFCWIHPKNWKDGKVDLKDIRNRFFLLVDKVEFVCTYSGNVKDIYHHQGTFDEVSRWTPLEKEKEEDPSDEKTTVKDMFNSSFIATKTGDIPLGAKSTYEPVKRRRTFLPGANSEEKFVKGLWNHNFVYKKDIECVTHLEKYSSHKKPDECDECILEAAQTLADMSSLQDIIQHYPTQLSWANWNADHEHDWRADTYSSINLDLFEDSSLWPAEDDTKDEYWGYWTFPAAENCAKDGCDIRRYLTHFYWLPDEATGELEERQMI